MRYDLDSSLPQAIVTVPPPEVKVNLRMAKEDLPPGIEEHLVKLGWQTEYSHSDNAVFFRRTDGPYAYGYYKWYEVVALEVLNFTSLGNSRPQAPTDEQLTAAANAINSQ